MTVHYRDLRYIRIASKDTPSLGAFLHDTIGLQAAGEQDGRQYFRSDHRGYSVCADPAAGQDAVALTVGTKADLAAAAERLTTAKVAVSDLDEASCAARQIKAGIVCRAPNGVAVEIVWRPMHSGWRYHGPRDAGIVDLLAVSLTSTDIAADEAFWTDAIGLTVSDWAGDACYLRLDDKHHRIAIYPSKTDGLFGIEFEVEELNNVMQGYYYFQGHQVPVVQGPGKEPVSDKIFVTARGPRGILFTYGADMARGDAVTARIPRQYPADPASFCAWGSPTDQPEFLGTRT